MSTPYSGWYMQNLKMALLCYFWRARVSVYAERLVQLYLLEASVCVKVCLQASAVSQTSVSINVFLLWVHKHRFTDMVS